MQRLDARPLSIAVLCAIAAAARFIVGPHIVDDAYITMRYSRNLSSMSAMSYNPPEPVLGTSSPLWTWVLAAGSEAGVAPETTAIAVASAADIGSIVLLMTSPAAGSVAALASAATIAGWPAYVTYAVSGMETSLYVLIVVLFVTSLSRGHTMVSAAAASLGALCRPDGALLVVLGFVWTGFVWSKLAALRFVTMAATICVPWVVYAFVRFGSFVPASVSAKASASDPWFLSIQNVQAYFSQGIYVPMTGLALIGFGLFLRSGGPFWRLWSFWGWSYLAAMTAANGFTHVPWYFVPLLPIYIAAAASGASGAWHLATEGAWHLGQGGNGGWHLPWKGGWHLAPEGKGGWHFFRKSARQSWGQALAAAALGLALLSRMPALRTYLETIAAGREKLYAAVAAELAALDAHCTVAATEIGTIGYYYPGRVLDLAGLVSPEVIGRPVDTVLVESGARWLVTYDTHFDRTAAQSELFSSLYERRRSVPVGDTRALEIYERRTRAGCGTS
jgi:hypothetical protein